MAELVVVACLLAEPQHCEEFHLPFARPIAVAQCMTKQPTVEVVHWALKHRDWTIRRWTCAASRA